MFTKVKFLHCLIVLVCLVLAGYFTTIQFIRYVKNDELSVLSYRELKFDSKSKDQYPAYTVCITGKPSLAHNFDGMIKKNSSILFSNSISRKEYVQFLYGKLDDKNSSDVSQKFSKIKYEDVSIDLISDILTAFSKCDPQSLCYYVNKKDYFTKVHQQPKEQCYSISMDYKNESEEFIRAIDIFAIDVSNLLPNLVSLEVEVFVHQRGQFIRHISSKNSAQVASLNIYNFKNQFKKHPTGRTFELTFSIGNVVMLRKLRNNRGKCNNSLMDEDAEWREVVMQQVGCVPVYWVHFIHGSFFGGPNSSNCTQAQYRHFMNIFNAASSFKQLSRSYINPCTEMEREVLVQRKDMNDETQSKVEIVLKFEYSSQRYLEVQNREAYDGETLLGQVGGFIGA